MFYNHAMQLVTVPDFAGDDRVHSVAWIIANQGLIAPPMIRKLLIASTTSNKTSRLGDATVSATCGIPFADMVRLDYDAAAPYPEGMWKPTELFVYAGTGDVIAIAYAIDD